MCINCLYHDVLISNAASLNKLLFTLKPLERFDCIKIKIKFLASISEFMNIFITLGPCMVYIYNVFLIHDKQLNLSRVTMFCFKKIIKRYKK